MSRNRIAVRKAAILAGVGTTHPLTIQALMAGYDPKQLDGARRMVAMQALAPGEIVIDEARAIDKAKRFSSIGHYGKFTDG